MIQDKIPSLPPRPDDGHKGLFGRVLIVGGAENMLGAPILAGESALRMGSGLVQVAMPASVLAPGLSVCPELIGVGLDESSMDDLGEAAESADVIIIGPGMGTSAAARERLAALIRLDKPMVIDADGLNLLAKGESWPKAFRASAVLTPHPGEMKRLAKLFDRDEVPSDEAGRIEIAKQAADAFGQIIVLKGNRTIITDGKKVAINTTGDSSLSKAGSGDVLSGMIGSLIGQGMDRFDAAVLGIHLHGRAGEIAGERLGKRSVLARDVIDAIAAAIREHEPSPSYSGERAG